MPATDKDGNPRIVNDTVDIGAYEYQEGALNQPPVIDSFTANPTSGTAPLTVTFTCDAHDPDGYITEYRWDFDGDGNIDETTTANTTTYTYQNAGTYYAKVTVVDNDGAITTLDSITINVIQPGLVSVDIKINGSNGPITLYTGNALNLSISVNPGDAVWEAADYFLWVEMPNGDICSYIPGYGWLCWPVPLVGHQGPLLTLDNYPVLSTFIAWWLPRGTYTFHFAIDLDQNALLDPGNYQDTAVMNLGIR